MSGLDLGLLSVMVIPKRTFSILMVQRHRILWVALASRRTMPLWAAEENGSSSLRPRKGACPENNTSKLPFDGIWAAEWSQLKKFHEGLPCNPLAVSVSLLWAKVYCTIAWEIRVYGLCSFLASGSSERRIKCRADLSLELGKKSRKPPWLRKAEERRWGRDSWRKCFLSRALKDHGGVSRKGLLPAERTLLAKATGRHPFQGKFQTLLSPIYFRPHSDSVPGPPVHYRGVSVKEVTRT